MLFIINKGYKHVITHHWNHLKSPPNHLFSGIFWGPPRDEWSIVHFVAWCCTSASIQQQKLAWVGKEKPLTFRILGFNCVKTLGAPYINPWITKMNHWSIFFRNSQNSEYTYSLSRSKSGPKANKPPKKTATAAVFVSAVKTCNMPKQNEAIEEQMTNKGCTHPPPTK